MKLQIILHTKIRQLFLRNSPLFLTSLNEVVLIGYDDFWNFGFLDFVLDFLEPHFKVLKALGVSEVKHDNNSMTLPVVRPRDRLILLCSR
jgi:hypothetical protein